MMRSLFVFLALVAVASAAPKQIGLNPPPPPASTSSAPGIGFSVVVPGYTAATWTAAQSAQLCAGLVNNTVGYPKSAIQCAVNAVTTTLPSSVNAVAAGGIIYFQSWPGSTSADATAATNARNLLISQLKQTGNTFLNATFAGANLNNTCDAAWTPATAGSASSILPIAGVPFGICRIAPRGYEFGSVANAAVEAAVTQAALKFNAANVPTTSVGTFGIDNGKTCASGPAFVTAGSTSGAQNILRNTVGNGATIAIAAAANGVQQITITLAAGQANGLLAADSLAAGYVLKFAGLVAADITNAAGAATCTAQAIADALNTYQTVTSFTVGNTGTILFNIPTLGCNAATVLTTSNTVPAAAFTATGAWSPLCDNNNGFYTLYNAGSTTANTASFGRVCPRCATSGSSNLLFTYNGANAGKFCSTLSTRGVSGAPTDIYSAGLAGSSCIAIGVSDYGAGSANTGKPMLTSVSVFGNSGISIPTIFPTAGSNPVGSFGAGAVMPYDPSTTAGTGNTAAYKNVALDTEWLVPCSTPAITQPTSTTVTPVLGVTTGAGSCNTVSLFENGGTVANGVTVDSYTEAILATQFNAAVAPAPPPPSPPTVVPSPAPASPPVRPPSPTPSPSPSPITPSPAPAVTCTYSGTYLIESVACSGKFIAYTNDPNTGSCKNATLMLRTAQQSKSPRNNWKLSATAVSGTVPTATGMIASGRSGKCTNDKYTNLAAANSSPTPRLAGSGWKNRIIPVDAAKGCDTVWIQAAGDNPFAGKYLGYGSCSSQTAFKWEAASSSSAIQWKLTKQ